MKLFKIRLNLFDGTAGGAAGAGTGTGSGATAGSEGTAEQGGQINPGSTRRGSGELANVIYGKQAEGSSVAGDKEGEVSTTSNTLEDRRKAFQDLINGEYKDLYTEATQNMINKRFKEAKTAEEQLAKQQGLVDTLAARYGVSDIDGLTKAVKDDNAFWAEAAEANGMTVEQYKEFNALKQQNERLIRAQEQRQADAKVQAQIQQWTEEEAALKQSFPNFSLANEMANPEFVNLLKARVPMEHAYKLLHMDELMQSAARVTEKAVVSGIRARGARPQENGTSSQSAFTVKSDPAKFTKKDRAEIARRVARGEHIEL